MISAKKLEPLGLETGGRARSNLTRARGEDVSVVYFKITVEGY